MTEDQMNAIAINEDRGHALSERWGFMQIAARFRPVSIRSRLFVTFVLMALLPVIAIVTVSRVVGLPGGRQQVVNQLESVATLKEAELNTWASSLQADLAVVIIGDETIGAIRAVLLQASNPVDYQVGTDYLRQRLGQMVEETQRLDELFLMDLDRRVVLSTDPQQEGYFGGIGNLLYFQEGLEGEYLHPPSYLMSRGGIAAIAARPILDEGGSAIGILAGRAGMATLNQIMLERTGLGETGETYLVASSQVALTEPRFRKNQWPGMYHVFTAATHAAVQEHTSGYGWYDNYAGDRVIGVVRWLPELQVALLAEQSESEALGPVYITLGIQMGIAVAVILIAGLVSVSMARGIASPLADLAKTAVRIAAGDLQQVVMVAQEDEIGLLAQAFNSMTVQLQDLINRLEERVKKRTRALRRRALQLQTIMRVSREINSILDIDELLVRVVGLIKEAFGYYFVGILLMNEQRNSMVFRAGSSGVGLRQEFERTPFPVGGGSLNGQVAESQQAVIVNDISQDPRFLAIDSLPDTRSELIVPLFLGDQIIGTLDIHSSEPNAFSQDDLRVVQTLGDQVAIAIENARLYKRSREVGVIEERNRMARELHDSVTQSLYAVTLYGDATARQLKSEHVEMAAENVRKLQNTARQALVDMRLLIFEMRPPILQEEGLIAALEMRLQAVEKRAGLLIAFHVEGANQLPVDVEDGLYRIALEALNNALKHACARSVTVSLTLEPRRVRMEVVDDGIGFDTVAGRESSCVGLQGMAERAERMGGRLSVESELGVGTTVRVEVDL